MIQQNFTQNPTLETVQVLIVKVSKGACCEADPVGIAPILSLKVSRDQWEIAPNIQH